MMPSPYPVRPVDSSSLQSLGIIAGSRELPLLVAREARRQGVPHIVAVAFRDETSPEIESLADEVDVEPLRRLLYFLVDTVLTPEDEAATPVPTPEDVLLSLPVAQ